MFKIKLLLLLFVNFRCLKKLKVLVIKNLLIVLLIELDNYDNFVDVNNLFKRSFV